MVDGLGDKAISDTISMTVEFIFKAKVRLPTEHAPLVKSRTNLFFSGATSGLKYSALRVRDPLCEKKFHLKFLLVN